MSHKMHYVKYGVLGGGALNFLSALHAVYGILVDMHRLYGLSPPPNPYSPQGRPAGFDPAVQFVADTLCPDSVSQKVLTLSTGRQIVEVGCEMAAYQGMFRYAWRDGSGPVLDERGQPLALVGLPDFDLRADALISLEKARGVGGCGEWYRLSLQGDRFVEIEHRSRRCSESELVIDPRK